MEDDDPGQTSYLCNWRALADAISAVRASAMRLVHLPAAHSLVPMMKLRPRRPEHLVDLHGVASSQRVSAATATNSSSGAMTTQHELWPPRTSQASPCPFARDRATDCRSPGALPRHHRRQRRQWRSRQRHAGADDDPWVPATGRARPAHARSPPSEFYQGAYFTALEPGEIPTSISIPVPPTGRRRLRETRAQGRRLRHRRGHRRADDVRRQGRDLFDRPHQSRRNAAARRRRGLRRRPCRRSFARRDAPARLFDIVVPWLLLLAAIVLAFPASGPQWRCTGASRSARRH